MKCTLHGSKQCLSYAFAHALKKLLLPCSPKRKTALKNDQPSVKMELTVDL